VITLSLTINYSTTTDTAIQACDTYHWDATDITYTESCHNQASLTNNWGCDSNINLQLTIYHSDSIFIADTICQGNDYTFHGISYNYSDTLIFDTLNSQHCDSIITLNLVVVDPPSVSIQSEFDCTRYAYQLEAITQAPHLCWYTSYDNTPTNVNEPAVSLNVTDTMLYIIMADLRDTFFCPSYDSILLTPIDTAIASIVLSPDTLDEQHLTLTANSLGSHGTWKQWYVNDEYYSDSPSYITYTADLSMDNIWIELIVGNEYCEDTTKASANIIHPHIYIPNIFIPSSEDPNLNTFNIRSTDDLKSYEITIYDRAGRIVYYSTDISDPWDGKHAGVPCPQGNYVYHIRYTTSSIPNGWQTKTGSILLCR